MDQSAEALFAEVIGDLVLMTLCTGILIPITIHLFVSRSKMWKSPVFIANVCALSMGFAFGGLAISFLVTILGQVIHPRIVLACSILNFLIPLTVSVVLFIRLLAVYPPRTLSKIRLVLVYVPFLLGLLARCVMAGLIWWKTIAGIDDAESAFELWQITWVLPYPKVEWALELFCDT
ncbi:hypothetical protein BD311DRAFT_663458 [Dichomitus squalens]|uniref:G-protein coupled receptors family 1 profile domain-containing protein n=1 Tax=Dichomitus squalens TaxID=114155 RepID=A0A4Q9MN70_9APHY|nr:hypothetical protein BD311DRAFT_663458 [Dichomitus squalens]